MVNLTITIKSANVTIEFKPHKQLVGNIYQPITIFKPKVNSSVVKFMVYIKKAIKFCSRLIRDINETLMRHNIKHARSFVPPYHDMLVLSH